MTTSGFRLLVFLTLGPVLWADHVVVSRAAKLYAEPRRGATIAQELQPGDKLALTQDNATGSYYAVRSPSGKAGFVARSMVRRVTGNLPAVAESAESRHLKLGKPVAVFERFREGYAVAVDSRLKVPVWVQYELRKEDVSPKLDRTDDFRPDLSLPALARATPGDYERSGYDQGHLAPAGDMVRSERVMSESFLMSNMAPQVGIHFNRHFWSYLEDKVREWAKDKGAVTVIVGPVYQPKNNEVKYPVIGRNALAVPTHFFKIVVDTNDPTRPAALAFLVPNEAITHQRFEDYLVSIASIEKLTGLDFLSALPTAQQRTLEAEPARELWPLSP